ncbi:hypothetical protein CRUP_026353 [Coryphaenoides rupestris]|nr:hypothetical protein CRUP_026353 [Coryphaenoides rupestris]
MSGSFQRPGPAAGCRSSWLVWNQSEMPSTLSHESWMSLKFRHKLQMSPSRDTFQLINGGGARVAHARGGAHVRVDAQLQAAVVNVLRQNQAHKVPEVPAQDDHALVKAAAAPTDTPAAPTAPSRAPALPPCPSTGVMTSTTTSRAPASPAAPTMTLTSPAPHRSNGPPTIAPNATWHSFAPKKAAFRASRDARSFMRETNTTSCSAWRVSTAMTNVASIPMQAASIQNLKLATFISA